MKIEDLNKTQIVMLTLLVSFMTSIATGIVTVSLMEQAPQTLPQTINRVIERTVEKVTPAVTGKPTVVTKETTVVVKEEDLITKSISTASKSMIAVNSRKINAQGLAEDIFIGWGAIIKESGIIITDSEIITSDGSYSVGSAGEAIFVVKILKQDEKAGVAVLEAVIDKTDSKQNTYNFKPITVSKVGLIKLGQTAISVGGKSKLAVAIGTVDEIIEEKQVISETSSTTITQMPKVIAIDASISAPQGVRGSLLLNSFGETIGIYLGVSGESTNVFTPIELALLAAN